MQGRAHIKDGVVVHDPAAGRARMLLDVLEQVDTAPVGRALGHGCGGVAQQVKTSSFEGFLKNT
jgi:hypothetical protein